jgi:hypothetical protein
MWSAGEQFLGLLYKAERLSTHFRSLVGKHLEPLCILGA